MSVNFQLALAKDSYHMEKEENIFVDKHKRVHATESTTLILG